VVKVLMGFALAAALLLGLESHRGAELQARPTAEQEELLAVLIALGRPAVSQLVADWGLLYPEPNEDRLQELRDIAYQLRTNPESLAEPDARAQQHTGVPANAALR
jgi:hypothetical protein